MVHKMKDGKYVISSNRVWLAGVYDSNRTASYAFRFKVEDLLKLQEEKNKTTRVITLTDLQDLRKKNAQKP